MIPLPVLLLVITLVVASLIGFLPQWRRPKLRTFRKLIITITTHFEEFNATMKAVGEAMAQSGVTIAEFSKAFETAAAAAAETLNDND